VFLAYRESAGRRRAWDPERPGNRQILIELFDRLSAALHDAEASPVDGHELLDVGCGTGPLLEALAQRGAAPGHLHGVDLLEHAVAAAEQRLPGVDVRVADARALPYPAASMDAVVMCTVLSSVIDPHNRARLGAEALRVLRPDGCVVVYDFRVPSPRNPNVRPITPSVLRRAFPDCTVQVRPLTLMPPLTRMLGRAAPLLYPRLAAVPFLRTHLLSVIRRRQPETPSAAV
jgi:ubiquinone/menaquinone biosynthesis C-methylase UbiE